MPSKMTIIWLKLSFQLSFQTGSQNLFPKLVKPGSQDDRLGRRPSPEFPLNLPWTPSASNFLHVWSIFAHPKTHQKSHSSKHCQKPQKSDPWSPKCRFWDDFWGPFGHRFSWNSRFCHNLRKPPKCLYTKHFGEFSPFKTSHFSTLTRSKIHTFFDASFWTSFFDILGRLGAKMLDFGPPLAPSWAPNGTQNRASIAKSLKKNIRGAHFLWSWKTTCFQYHFWSVPGHHFRRFGMDFGWILMDFGIIFQCISEFFAIRFVDCERRLTRSDLTATFEKMPRTAKNWQKPKSNDRRPANYTLQHAAHETRSTEANVSNNTGSAVLAPHGAFGYPKPNRT